jgi:YggT family protein
MQTLGMILDVVMHLYLVFIVLRLLVDPRLFHFNPTLGMIKQATDPLLSPLQRALGSPGRAVLAALGIVILVRGILMGVLSPDQLVSSPAAALMRSLWIPVVTSIFMSVQYVLDWLLVALLVSLVLTLLIEPYTTNPISRFAFRLVGLAEAPLRGLTERLGAEWLKTLLVGGAALVGYTVATCLLLAPLALAVAGTVPLGVLLKTVVVSGLYLGISYGIGFFVLALIVNALLSWFSPDPNNALVRFLHSMAYPILAPFRRFIPLVGGIDISPIFAILLLGVTRDVALNLLARMMALL